MTNKRKFSIIVPVYQNESNLHSTVPTLLSIQEKIPAYNLELIFVDDGSTDSSYNLLLKYHNLYKEKIKVVKLTKNFGQIPAIQAGLKMADGDCAGIISADLQDPPELFVEMIQKWENGTKLVIAERTCRKEMIRSSLLSKYYWRMVSKYAVKNCPEGGFDFCLIDKQIISDVNNMSEKNTHVFILFFSLGYKYEVIPFTRKERTAGESQWKLSQKIKLFMDTFISFSYMPVQLITFFGFIISVISFLFAFAIAASGIILEAKYKEWTAIAVLVSFFGGLILLTLGIIAEYLWRILDEIRKRPNYVIDKIHDHKQESENDILQ